ncbi:MAG: MBL fold metallo-hydrolase [Chloroflexi bacterium]|nr:MBL fold metallo-hydrolase [Chloroflexota bacterium]
MTLTHSEMDLRIFSMEVGSWGNNCYVVVDPLRNTAAIIDAAADAAQILDAVAGLDVLYILTTHGHSDHWGALEEVSAALPNAIVAATPGDAGDLPVSPTLLLDDGDTLQIGTAPLRVIATPGHTPGSACYITGQHLFTGDTLFPGGPGHSRSPENLREEITSITTKLYVRPDETIVYPGHGAGTTIGESKADYAVFAAKSHPDDLYGDVLWLES